MIILFAPAKGMKLGKGVGCSNINTKLHFQDKTNELINTVLSWDKSKFLESFKISNNLYEEVYSFYKNFNNNEAYRAFELFYGESFKFFDYNSLSNQEVDYLNSKVIIIDALYGIIKPNSLIKPYRLDFRTKNLDIVSFWKKEINDYFSKYNDMEILSLASKEFSSILTKDKKIIDVKFIDEVNGIKKAISVFNKQMRGRLLRYIIKNKIKSISDLPIEIDGYLKEVEDYKKQEIIYVKR